MPVSKKILEQIKHLIPPLNGTLHKGQSGRVGVLGGALDYTGAPFFASMSAQRMGADLSHVICSPTAASAIKSYSPDLIVHPILREDQDPLDVKPALQSLLSRLHVLVIGPGLGREPYMQQYAKMAVNIARERAMFLVLDADALLLVGEDKSLVRGYRRAVLTPNVVEFKRLSEQVNIDPKIPPDQRAMEVSRAFGGVTILQKGAEDIIATNTASTSKADPEQSGVDPDASDEKTEEQIVVDVKGGLKRCGGQGDILSGTVATALAWGKCFEDGAFGDGSVPSSRIPLLAAVAGSMVTRTASKRAFAKNGRGVVTQDMLPEVGGAFVEIFGSEGEKGWGGNVEGKL
ncbi:Ribokinase-like protein [Irpex rosettiformis]|uniref:Ribokinase-like protein n=1 Tax=Irpex rosettiformis TaxID=378272 RepID=A0ACB8UBB6_9APHY|nr:Ribokinase-like protein [Irpex rosettiformis]